MTLTHWQSPIPLGLQRSISDSSRCPAKRGTRCTPRTDVDATTFVRCCIHHPHHQLPPLRTWRPMPETTSTPCSQCHLHITHSHTKFKQAVFLLHKYWMARFHSTRRMTVILPLLPAADDFHLSTLMGRKWLSGQIHSAVCWVNLTTQTCDIPITSRNWANMLPRWRQNKVLTLMNNIWHLADIN